MIDRKQQNKIVNQGRWYQSLNPFSFSKRKDKTDLGSISVDSGLHKGTERSFSKDEIIIGSGNTADIILLDDGIEDSHVSITVSKDIFGGIYYIKALSEGVEIENYGELKVDESISIRGDTGIKIKDTDLTLSNSNNKNSSVSFIGILFQSLSRSFARGYSSMLLVLGMVLMLFGFLMLSDLIFQDNIVSDKPLSLAEVKKLTPNDFLIKLQQELQKRGLEKQISARIRNKNSIEVSGQTTEKTMPSWLGVLRWYDEQYPTPPLFNLVRQTKDVTNFPKIKYAWYGERPYIVLSNDQKVYLGDDLLNGWKVQKIDGSGVKLFSSEKTIMIKFE